MAFRVCVCLDRFFSDERAYAYMLVEPNELVGSLVTRLRLTFRLGNIRLMCNNHYLPPSEPLGLLGQDESIMVVPQYPVWWEENHSFWSASTELIEVVRTPTPTLSPTSTLPLTLTLSPTPPPSMPLLVSIPPPVSMPPLSPTAPLPRMPPLVPIRPLPPSPVPSSTPGASRMRASPESSSRTRPFQRVYPPARSHLRPRNPQ